MSTICSQCGAELKRAPNKFCPVCGKPFTAANPTPQPSTPAADQAHTSALNQAQIEIISEGVSTIVILGSQPQTIGRAPDNTIVLSAGMVSGHHARIEAHGQQHQIIDVGSTNGLRFEGERLTINKPHLLYDGDVIRIGDPATGNVINITYSNPQAVRSQAQQSKQVLVYPLDLNDQQITIGRAGNEINLDNPQVSRNHAVLERINNQHVLRDVGSTNGTFVNGQRITQHTLVLGDVIQIGAFKLLYNGDSLIEYDQRGSLRLDARQLTYRVKTANGSRIILHNVSLSIAPREFIALVGGSGAGKSTLLKALSGFAQASQGQVFINSDDYYKNFDAYRSIIGYVPQDDIIHRSLPVERALGYTAKLRLADDTAPTEIQDRIEHVLTQVDMSAHRHTIVDRLSGGQRKRVSIAAELLADPSLFFLDEPTSGLDPGLEKKMMYTLRQLADSGRIVVLVTHATANIMQCDHVVFMSQGRMVFFGPPTEALNFFGVGSGDFADIYSKLDGYASNQDRERWAIVQKELSQEYAALQQAKGNQLAENPPSLGELWEIKFRNSPYYQRYVEQRLSHAPMLNTQTTNNSSLKPQKVSQIRQFGILLRRNIDLLLQDKRNLALLLLQAPIIALLIMLVATSDALVGDNAFASDAKKVLFMLATVGVWFGILNAAREIVKEAPIYKRERLANLHIGPYLFSKITILGLLIIIQSALLIGIIALKIHLPSMGVFLPGILELYLTTLFTSAAGLALGLLLSASSSTPDRATSSIPLLLIPQILFAGVIFSLGSGITAQRLISWLTISRWSMDAYGTSVNINDLPAQPGFGLLPNPPAEYTFSLSHLLSRWGILLAYMLICIGLTAWQLKQIDKQQT